METSLLEEIIDILNEDEIRDLSAVCDIYYDCETFTELFMSEVGGRLGLNQNTAPVQAL